MDIDLIDIVLFLAFISFVWTVSQALRVLMRRYGDRRWDKRKSKSRSKAIQYIFLLIGLYLGIYLFFWNAFTAEELVASLGIVSLAVAFISKKVFENVIAGLQISMEKKVEVEDWVELSKHNWKGPAKVTDISITKTMLRDSDGTEFVVPNNDINDSQFINYSKTGYAEIDIELPLPLNSDLVEVEKLLLPIIRSYPNVFPNVKYEAVLAHSGLAPRSIKRLLVKNIDLAKLDPVISVQSIKEKYMVFNVRCYVAQVNLTAKVKSDLTWMLWKELRSAKMTLLENCSPHSK
jgi:small-conductance mechanosensitive channel